MSDSEIFVQDASHKQGTVVGGILSLIMLALVAVFLYNQSQLYFSPQQHLTLINNHQNPRSLKAFLDISLNSMPCHLVSVDVQDQLLSHSSNVASIKKHRIINKTDQRRAFNSPQNQTLKIQDLQKSVRSGEGCRLYGNIFLKEIPGDFHISHHSETKLIDHLREVGLLEKINFSFRINQLYFGNELNLESYKKEFPLYQFQLTQIENQLKDFKTQQIYLDLLRLSDNSFFEAEPSYALRYSMYHYSPVQLHDIGIYFNLKVGQYNLQVSGGEQHWWEYVAWVLAVLSGITVIFQTLEKITYRAFTQE